MELVSALVFVPLVIIAITQMVKMALPQVSGFVTILIAVVVGVVVALLDTSIGVTDISVAQGIFLGLTAVGITTAASKAGGGTKGDE
jgi:hypothetical protein